MEDIEQTVTQGGLFSEGIPAWLVFMLVGVVVALVLIGTIKRRGVPFFGIIIVVIIVVLLLSGSGNLHLKEWYTEWSDKFFYQSDPESGREEPDESPQDAEEPPAASETEDGEDGMTTSENTWIEIALKNLFNND